MPLKMFFFLSNETASLFLYFVTSEIPHIYDNVWHLSGSGLVSRQLALEMQTANHSRQTGFHAFMQMTDQTWHLPDSYLQV